MENSVLNLPSVGIGVLALVLLLLFTVQLPVFPIGFSVPVGMAADEVSLADRLYHAFLPACTLGLTGISSIAMHTREKVIEILESDYVLYARARGESGWRDFRRFGAGGTGLFLSGTRTGGGHGGAGKRYPASDGNYTH